MAITRNDLDCLELLLSTCRVQKSVPTATLNQGSILFRKLEKLMAGQRLKHARDDDEWTEANGSRAAERRRISGNLTPAQQRAIDALYIDEGRA